MRKTEADSDLLEKQDALWAKNPDRYLVERQEAIWSRSEERDILRGRNPQPLPLSRSRSSSRLQDVKLRSQFGFKGCENRDIQGSGFKLRGKSSQESPDTLSVHTTAKLLMEYKESAENGKKMAELSVAREGLHLFRETGFSLAHTYFQKLHGNGEINSNADLRDSDALIAVRRKIAEKRLKEEKLFLNFPYIDQDDALEVTLKARIIRKRIPSAILNGIAEENERSRQVFDVSKYKAHVAWKRILLENLQGNKGLPLFTVGPKASRKLGWRGHSVTAIGSNAFLVFGGEEGPKLSSSLFKLNLNPTRWESIETTGSKPCARAFHSVVYDIEENKMICFGGLGGRQSLDDCFKLDIAHLLWEPIFPEMGHRTPAARHGHTLTQVSKSGAAVLFGGAGAGFYDDVFLLDIKTGKWVDPTISGTPPTARAFHTACPLVNGSKVLVFGGTNGSQTFADLHVLDITTDGMAWSRVEVHGPTPCARWGHGAMANGMDSMIVFGGGGDAFHDDVLVYNAFKSVWFQFRGPGESPCGRWGHAMWLSEDTQTLLVLGGCGAGKGRTCQGDAYLCFLDFLQRGQLIRSPARPN
jgi:hypothetical protein